MTRLGWALLLVLAARTAGAAELRDLLAVLEVAVEDNAVPDSAAVLLTDQLRSASRKVAGERLKIMTRENMTELLPPGTNQRCFVGACLAQIGVMLQARYVMGGTIRKGGKRLALTVEAYDSNSRNLLGSEVLFSQNVDELFDLVLKEAPGWVRSWIPVLAAATVATAPPEAAPVVSAPPAPVVAANPPPSSVVGRYLVGADTVRDTKTGLTWQRKVRADRYNWNDAKAYCAALGLVGGGWRLPTKEELEGLVDKSAGIRTIEHEAFPDTPDYSGFWSSTPAGTSGAWY